MNATHTCLSTLALACVLLLPAAAVAEPPTFDLSLGGESRWMTSSSTRATSGDTTMRLTSATAGFHLGSRLPYASHLALDLGIEGGGNTGAIFQSVGTETRLLALAMSARATRPIVGPISGFTRAGLGLRRLTLSLEEGQGRARDGGWGPTMHLGAGLDATPLRASRGAAFGLRVETGYTLDAGESMSAARQAPDDGRILLPSSSAGLGRISASGFSLRMGLLVTY
jgi:hypothetical protein